MLDTPQSHHNEDILEIIKGCKENNRICQEKLYKKYAPQLLGVAVRYCRNRADAEDILQEAFIKIFKYINQLNGTDNPLPRMISIVIHTYFRVYDEKKKKISIKDNGIEKIPEKFKGTVDVEYMTAEKILEVIQTLPDGYREVLNLRIDGYKHREIAKILGIDTSTSKSQFSRVKKILAEILNGKAKV